MLTGKKCQDLDYMVYLLVKDGTYFKSGEDNIVRSDSYIIPDLGVPDLNSWFEGFVVKE